MAFCKTSAKIKGANFGFIGNAGKSNAKQQRSLAGPGPMVYELFFWERIWWFVTGTRKVAEEEDEYEDYNEDYDEMPENFDGEKELISTILHGLRRDGENLVSIPTFGVQEPADQFILKNKRKRKILFRVQKGLNL